MKIIHVSWFRTVSFGFINNVHHSSCLRKQVVMHQVGLLSRQVSKDFSEHLSILSNNQYF